MIKNRELLTLFLIISSHVLYVRLMGEISACTENFVEGRLQGAGVIQISSQFTAIIWQFSIYWEFLLTITFLHIFLKITISML